jgi:hypothetical protein
MTMPTAESAMPLAAPGTPALSITMPIATTFELFPKLPPELRLRIWGYTILPRVIDLIYDQERDQFLSFNSMVPAILHVCRESRMVGLEVESLKPTFGTDSHSPKIWFDFARDVLFFDDWMSACSFKFRYFPTRLNDLQAQNQLGRPRYPDGSMDRDLMAAVELVAVNYDADDYLQVRRNARNMLSLFPNLKTLFVVLEGIQAHDRYNYPVIATERSAIQFVNIPATTVCEHESLQYVYWQLDQK